MTYSEAARRGDEDSIVWTRNTRGVFTVKSYFAMTFNRVGRNFQKTRVRMA